MSCQSIETTSDSYYAIQALLAVNPNKPEWANVKASAVPGYDEIMEKYPPDRRANGLLSGMFIWRDFHVATDAFRLACHLNCEGGRTIRLVLHTEFSADAVVSTEGTA